MYSSLLTLDLYRQMEKHILHAAVAQLKYKLVRILLEGGEDVNAQCYDGKTPLMTACCFFSNDKDHDERIKIVQLLFQYKADVNLQDRDGRTALMYAVRHTQSPSIIQELLRNNSNLNIQDYDGNDVFNYASQTDWPIYAKYLRPYLKSVTGFKNNDSNFTDCHEKNVSSSNRLFKRENGSASLSKNTFRRHSLDKGVTCLTESFLNIYRRNKSCGDDIDESVCNEDLTRRRCTMPVFQITESISTFQKNHNEMTVKEQNEDGAEQTYNPESASLCNYFDSCEIDHNSSDESESESKQDCLMPDIPSYVFDRRRSCPETNVASILPKKTPIKSSSSDEIKSKKSSQASGRNKMNFSVTCVSEVDRNILKYGSVKMLPKLPPIKPKFISE